MTKSSRGRLVHSYRRHRYQYNAALIGVGVTAVFCLWLFTATALHPYLIWLTGCNATAFLLFGVDKTLAKANRTRIPESVLHLFTLAGGFLGQWLGRNLFRHKTNAKKHPAFRIVLVISLLLHGALLYLFWHGSFLVK